MANKRLSFLVCALLFLLTHSHLTPFISAARPFMPVKNCSECLSKQAKTGARIAEESQSTTPGPSHGIGHHAKNSDAYSGMSRLVDDAEATMLGHSPGVGHQVHN
ncbi:hypothetical protein H6P81_010926 [Aristolochia fimbriata]|uniref:Uncharacterized protein n=1 Tax=Aristolochia fimbriata TaxID=158543 RepID=A0AAV7ETL6_ARIFI|nr:hypothetical protein H6P81_010926 [Aristolochia fimbriata]